MPKTPNTIITFRPYRGACPNVAVVVVNRKIYKRDREMGRYRLAFADWSVALNWLADKKALPTARIRVRRSR